MRAATLVRRSLEHYWKSNLAVVLGVGTAVAVLAGALMVGDSVRSSLRKMVLNQLGRTDDVITATNVFFREELAEDIARQDELRVVYADACPLLVFEGVVTNAETKRRAGGVQIYGIDDRFPRFHELTDFTLPQGNATLISRSLASELGVKADETVLIRIEKPSAIPTESLHGRKDDTGVTMRANVTGVLDSERMGDFSLRPQQTGVKALFIPLARLQRNLEQDDKANTILLKRRDSNRATTDVLTAVRSSLRKAFSLADLGLRVRKLEASGTVSLESDSALISDSIAARAQEAAEEVGLAPSPVLTYLANTIASGDRVIPYSLVTALSEDDYRKLKGSSAEIASSSGTPLLLNAWAAQNLQAGKGSRVRLEYYLWRDDGVLDTASADFVVDGIVPLSGPAADRDYAPDYPGITEAQSLGDWDPPFPIDLSKVRPVDEDYWNRYRTTPKAFVLLPDGQRLWQSRFGKLTSIRFHPRGEDDLESVRSGFTQALRSKIDPIANGFVISPVRQEGLAASSGATDFGEYFTYFSFFIVAAALLLASLFFRLGVEQRVREIGLLRSVGFAAPAVRNLFLKEGILLAVAGGILGIAGAIGYAWLIMYGLRNWWVGAVGTTMLTLDPRPVTLAVGVAAGVFTAIVCLILTLRAIARVSPRSLLTGGPLSGRSLAGNQAGRGGWMLRVSGLVAGLAAIVVLGGVAIGVPGQTAGFFIAGTLLLYASVSFWYRWFRSDRQTLISGIGMWSLVRLGFRNASSRPGRSALCIALVAAATFIITAVDAFRRDAGAASQDRRSGTGGYSLMGETLLPVVINPQSESGREELNLTGEPSLDGVTIERFRLKPGDDSSCLNLYQPKNPRILGAREEFIRENRFSFGNTLASTPEEKENPWRLLERESIDGAVPVIADANSIAYVLHVAVGDELLLGTSSGTPLRLRVAGALSDSVLQGELVMSEKNFLRLFPDRQGYRYFLIDAPDNKGEAALTVLEDRLSDYGFDGSSTAERLASYHQSRKHISLDVSVPRRAWIAAWNYRTRCRIGAQRDRATTRAGTAPLSWLRKKALRSDGDCRKRNPASAGRGYGTSVRTDCNGSGPLLARCSTPAQVAAAAAARGSRWSRSISAGIETDRLDTTAQRPAY